MPARAPLPSPLWAVLTLPFGLTVGFATIAVPYTLRARGLDMTTIASVSQFAQLPHVFKLLWSPALDAGPRRKTWYLASVAATAAFLAITAVIPPDGALHLGPVPLLWVYAATLCGAQAAVATSGSAVLALMAVTVPEERRGAAAGWQTTGNLAGTALGGALIAWMLGHVSPGTTALVLGTACAACAAPAWWVDDEPPPRRSAIRLMAELLREAWATIRSTDGWTGLLICASPVGAGALTNLFSAVAVDYARDAAEAERLVLVVSGVLGGIVNALGALLGGLAADRMNRRLAYALFGGLTALAAVAMALAPATPAAFTVGFLAYQFFNGICCAAFYAFVLDLLGHRRGVTTQLALYVGVANFASTYVTWLDGWSYDRARSLFPTRLDAGRTGMLAMDAASTFVGLGVLAIALAVARRQRRLAVVT